MNDPELTSETPNKDNLPALPTLNDPELTSETPNEDNLRLLVAIRQKDLNRLLGPHKLIRLQNILDNVLPEEKDGEEKEEWCQSMFQGLAKALYQ